MISLIPAAAAQYGDYTHSTAMGTSTTASHPSTTSASAAVHTVEVGK